MTEVDREIALALLKRLWKRELISEETYVSASSSRFLTNGNLHLILKPSTK